jgi:tRNA threonylcarbamoyladenosine biosynthesis protein TsaB
MAAILCIETSTTQCSVAIVDSQGIRAVCQENSLSYSHAEKLHLFIEQVLRDAEVSIEELIAVAVSQGPGSYTGLRIGVSAAKGLCFALDIPLIALPTLTILARQIESPPGFIIPMIDARRMEVYTCVFDQDLNTVEPVQARVLEPESWDKYLNQSSVCFLGDGIQKFKEICNHPQAQFVDGKFPSAREMGVLAMDKYKKSDFVDVAYFEPFYLKDFISK